MLPVISTVNTLVPIQTTLVSTPIPETNTLRVPPDNVPPSVSSVQINNNARGNSNVFVLPEEELLAPAAPPPQGNAAVSYPKGSPAVSNPGIQATFIAQLMSQDIPPSLQPAFQGILLEYEKMIAFSAVKYKPSNATLPQPEPLGVFGYILQQERSQRSERAPSAPTSVASEKPALRIEAPIAAPVQIASPVPRKASKEGVVSASPPPARIAVSAYAATSARNNAFAASAKDAAASVQEGEPAS